MKKCKIIGLTGQTGAGKSTVAKLFAEYNIKIIDADSIVHKIYSGASVCPKTLAAAFGNEVLNLDGTPNRPRLAKAAFSSKENLALLNSIVHPFVMYELLLQIKSEIAKGTETVAYDAPQLFESNSDLICDVIVSVVAEKSVRMQRICSRDGIAPEAAEARINAQLNEEYFRKNSDYIIENNKGLNDLTLATETVLKQICPR